MIATIAPQYEWDSDQRLRRRLGPIVGHAAGLAAGGVVIYFIAALLGSALSPSARPVALGAIVVAGVSTGVAYLLGRSVTVPSSQWQVPKVWREVLPVTPTAFLYGVGLGFGVATRVPFAIFYLSLATLLVQPNLTLAIGAGLSYAFGRWLPVALLVSHDGTRSHVDLVERVYGMRSNLARAIGAAQLTGAAALVLGYSQ